MKQSFIKRLIFSYPHRILVIVTLIFGSIVFYIVDSDFTKDKENLIQQAELDSILLGQIFAKHIARTLDSLEILLINLKCQGQRVDFSNEKSRNEYFGYLRRTRFQSTFSSLYLLNGDGSQVFSTSSLQVYDNRALFEELIFQHMDHNLFFMVTPWVKNGDRVVLLSRRLEHPDRSQEKILVIEIHENLLIPEMEFQETLNIQQILLFNEQSSIFASWPITLSSPYQLSVKKLLGFSLSELKNNGVPGMIGGSVNLLEKDNMITVTQLQNFNLYLGVKFDLRSHLQEWRRSSQLIRITIFLGSGLISALLFLISRKFIEKQLIDKRTLLLLEKKVEQRTEELNQTLLEVNKLAYLDSLTGVLNRRRMEEILDSEFSRAKRYGSLFTLVMCDIDHFKKINDTMGHAEGDTAIIYTANLIKNNLRKTDTLARWGGEEFLILLPNTDHESAMEKIEKIRGLFEMTPWKKDYSLTCSFGVATLMEVEDLSFALNRADEALYRAKKTRNTVSGQYVRTSCKQL